MKVPMSASSDTASPASGESSKLRSIEAARALAALLVVLMHAANLMRVEHFSGHVGLAGIFDFGYVGVDFFFVLSGFIITYVHFAEIGKPTSIPRYLWRRFSRIYPIYWTILLIAIGLTTAARVASGKGLGFEIGLGDISGTVLLLMDPAEPKYVGVAWSLQFEVVFYLMFCLLLANARLGAAVFAAWGTYLVARALGIVSFDLPMGMSSAHCLEFLFGVIVGSVARRGALSCSFRVLPAVLGVFVLGVVFDVYGPFERHSSYGRIVLGLASAAILLTLVALESRRAIRPPAWLAKMGSVSYSIYLGHVLFINLVYTILLKVGLYPVLPEVMIFLIGLGGALAVTVTIGLYVELPLVGLLKNRWRGKSRSAPSAASGI